ncbi:MAG: amidohydrolase family protein [Acidobacteria bacterium]|nr:amidohydrolase family protein [Acidobacteriota bacterium]
MKSLALILVMIVSATLAAQAAPGPVALQCGQLLNVRSGEILNNALVLVEGERIREVGPASSVAVPSAAMSIDLSRSTCLPGLIDVHTHLTMEPTNFGYKSLGVSIPRATVYGVKNARHTLLAGFTTVRNLAADGYADVALRDGIHAGEIDGPRMLVSGPALGITGGHCDNNLLPPEFHFVSPGIADGPWPARAKVREVVKYGADVIKICASGGVLSKGDLPGTPQYTPEEMRAVVEEAGKLGRKVAAHAHGAQSIKDAIRAGIDSVEHNSLIDEEGIRLAVERGTFLIFDLYDGEFILKEGLKVGMLPESIEKQRQILQQQQENLGRAYRAKARIAFGTDAGVYPHGDNAREFLYLVKYGMKPLDAIRAATTNAAELLGWSDRVGSLEAGYFADVIAVQGNPLEDVSALQKVNFVMKGGRVFKNEPGR